MMKRLSGLESPSSNPVRSTHSLPALYSSIQSGVFPIGAAITCGVTYVFARETSALDQRVVL